MPAEQGVNTIFADNYLHDLCQGTADAGGFYAGDSWANRGNILRGNRFERLYPVEKMSQATAINGVYLDTLEAGWVVENNVFSSMEVGVFIAGGRQNTVTGNRFINCTTPVTRWAPFCGFSFVAVGSPTSETSATKILSSFSHPFTRLRLAVLNRDNSHLPSLTAPHLPEVSLG